MAECKKIRSCPHCNLFNGVVKKKPNEAVRVVHLKFDGDDIDELVSEFSHACSLNTALEPSIRGAFEEIDALKVLQLFLRIRDEDVALFDMDIALCRPADLLITHIPVPPSCIRPSVAVSTETSNEDDLTIKLVEILQLNTNIKRAM